VTVIDRVVSEYMAQGPFLVVARSAGCRCARQASGHRPLPLWACGRHNVGGLPDGFKAAAERRRLRTARR
jgi:hypothetical protein